MTGPRLPSELAEILAGEGVARSYPAGALLFADGDPPGPSLLVVSGEVEVRVAGGPVIATVGPGELVGDLSAVDAQPRSASASARTAVEVRAIAPVRFAALMDERADLCRYLLHVLSARLRQNSITLDSSRQNVPVDRVAAWILERVDEGDWVEVSLEQVADQLGASRELVSRAIDHLVGRGAVDLERGRLLVRSEEALAAVAHPDPV